MTSVRGTGGWSFGVASERASERDEPSAHVGAAECVMHVGHVGDNGRRKPPFLCDPKRSACGARRGGGGALYRPAMRNRWQRARESFRQGTMQCMIDGKLTDGVGGVWGSRLGRWRRLQAAQPGRRAHSRPAFLAQSTAAASAPTCVCVCALARVCACACVQPVSASTMPAHAWVCAGLLLLLLLLLCVCVCVCV
jgi:hypothetical protein